MLEDAAAIINRQIRPGMDAKAVIEAVAKFKSFFQPIAMKRRESPTQDMVDKLQNETKHQECVFAKWTRRTPLVAQVT